MRNFTLLALLSFWVGSPLFAFPPSQPMGQSKAQSKTKGETPELEKAPEFQGLSWVDYDEFWISSLRGNIIVLLFWNSQSKEFYHLLKEINSLVEDSFQGKGVRFLGISIENETTLLANAERLGIHFPLAVDNSAKTFKLYGIFKIPTVAIINPYGKIVSVETIEDSKGLEETLQKLFRENTEILNLRITIDWAKDAKNSEHLPEIIRKLQDIVSKTPPHPRLLEEALKALNQIEAHAVEALIRAHRDIEDGLIFKGANHLELISKQFAGTYSSKVAKLEIRQIRKSQDFKRAKKAQDLIGTAKKEIKKGNTSKAEEMLNRILKNYPNTGAAREAKDLLGNL